MKGSALYERFLVLLVFSPWNSYLIKMPFFSFLFRNLRDTDVFSKSDPMCVLFQRDPRTDRYFEVDLILKLFQETVWSISIYVGRILSIAMIGGLPCAVLSINILPGIWSICARCFVSTDRCAQCYDDVTILLGLHVNFVCLQRRETETHEKMTKAAGIYC